MTTPLSPHEIEARARRLKRRGARFFWIISLGTTMLGSFVGVAGFVSATGAPQEAAAAAIGLLIIVAPYVFARAVDEILRD